MRGLTLTQAALRLGGKVCNGAIRCPGPNHSRFDNSLAVWLTPEGIRVHSFAGDDWRVCIAHACALLGLEQWRPSLSSGMAMSSTAKQPEAKKTKPRAFEIWKEARDPVGTLVEDYLAGRGLSLPPTIAGRVIRFHPRLFHKQTGEYLPAMVSLFRDIRTNEARGIQRVWIREGKKFDLKAFNPLGGAAIKLTRDAEVMNGLTVAEGFESALAGYHFGFRPTWALGSAGEIAKFPPLPGIEAVTILTERNDHGKNAMAVKKCAALWHEAGKEVFTVEPLLGDDANDAWRGAA